MLGKLVVHLATNATKLTGGMKTAKRSVGSFVSSTLSRFKTLAIATTAIVGLTSIAGAASWGVQLAAQAEQAQVSFSTLLGSTELARKTLDDLSTFAASTPFDLNSLRTGAQQLLAFGVTSDHLMDRLQMLGDIAAGTGKPIGEFAAIFGKVKATGITSLEQVNQLAERGVPIYRTLAETMGVTQGDIRKLSSTGKIGYSELLAALQKTTAAGGVFAGGMKAQSQTVTGLFSTLKDNVGFAVQEVGQLLIDAFDFKGLLGEGISFAQGVKNAIRAIRGPVLAVAGVMRSVFGTVWSAIKLVFSSVQSVGSSAFGVVGDAIKSVQPHVMVVKEILSTMFDIVWSVGVTAFAYLESIASSVFGSVGNGATSLFNKFMTGVVTAFAIGEAAIQNWRSIAALAFVSTMLPFVRFSKTVLFFFTNQLPAMLVWFGQNWRSVFIEAVNFTANIFRNLSTNVKQAIGEIWDFIKSRGNDEIELAWKPLTDGFVSTLKTLPEIPKRELSTLERVLESQAASLGKTVSNSVTKNVQKRLGQIDVFRQQIEEAERMAKLAVPEVLKPKGDDGSATSKSDELKFASAKLTKGSADAFSAILKAQSRGKDNEPKKHTKLLEKQVTASEQIVTKLAELTVEEGG